MCLYILAASPPGSTHIQALDAHFFTAAQNHPSTLSSLKSGDVVEIQGPPASGKTHFLYHLVITTITPTTHLTTNLGGWDKVAVIFDTDGNFSIPRLHKLLQSRLTRLIARDPAVSNISDIGDLARKAMCKVHLFRPTSSVQLAASLLYLPSYHTAQLSGDEIGLLAVDSISSFYWPDRFMVEQLGSVQSSGTSGRGRPSSKSPLHHVLSSLEKIRLSHGPVIALTNWGINPLTKPTHNSAPTTFYKQHLYPFPVINAHNSSNVPGLATTAIASRGNPTANPNSNATSMLRLTHHITLPFVSIAPFRLGLSMEEAREQEKAYRRELVSKGEVVGIVRTSGSTRVGRFTFRIGDDEVIVDGT